MKRIKREPLRDCETPGRDAVIIRDNPSLGLWPASVTATSVVLVLIPMYKTSLLKNIAFQKIFPVFQLFYHQCAGMLKLLSFDRCTEFHVANYLH